MKIRWHLISILGIFVVAIILGAYAYHAVEGWNILDSFYFVVITVTTIGYGDLTPVTIQGKIFTMFYAFFGVAMALYILTQISSTLFKKHVGEKVSEIKRDIKKEEDVKKNIENVIKKNIIRKRNKGSIRTKR